MQSIRNFFLFILLCIQIKASKSRKNVLFIVVDDLRPDLGCYSGRDFPSIDDPPIHSPNIDALARKSFLAKRAYVQQALCGPSRTSFLTGRRPDSTRVYDLNTHFRNSTGDVTTLPQYFKNHGRVSVGIGKIYHQGLNDELSWSDNEYHYPIGSVWERQNKSWQFVPDADLAHEPLLDAKIAQTATSKMKQFLHGGKYAGTPFFMAVGFLRPHLPFVAPESFRSFYPNTSVKLPRNNYAPIGMPDVAFFKSSELRNQYQDIHGIHFSGNINESFPDDTSRNLRTAYYSAVSWVDSQVGVVLDALTQLGFADDTIVSLVGDHGWQLGEHGIWGKSTNFELATHAPMMVHIPGLTDGGLSTERLVEFVDLFPTIVDAVGLPKIPLCPKSSTHTVRLCTEGESFMPLIHNSSADWKDAAFSQFPRSPGHSHIMGYSLRTDRYRYTEWPTFSYQTHKPNWNDLHGVELYDHTIDPEENANRAEDPAYASLRHQLSWRLRAGWRQASPSLRGQAPPIVG